MRLALRVNERCNVRYIDGFGASTAWYKQVRLEAQVGAVAEVGTIRNDFSRGKLDVLVLDAHKVAVAAELRDIEVADGNAELRETDELGAVEACRVGEYTRAVDDRDGLVRAEQDLV